MSVSNLRMPHKLAPQGTLKYVCDLADSLLLPGVLVAGACLIAAYLTVATNSGWLVYLALATGVYTVLHIGHIHFCHKDSTDSH